MPKQLILVIRIEINKMKAKLVSQFVGYVVAALLGKFSILVS